MIRAPKTQKSRTSSGEAMPFGRLLATTRKKLGLTQTVAASSLGMTNAQLSRIEHGADLRVSTLLDVARFLKLEPMLIPKNQVSSVRALLNDEAELDETPERGRFA
jgi:transcriptional regulator with XRE-family HTH domain